MARLRRWIRRVRCGWRTAGRWSPRGPGRRCPDRVTSFRSRGWPITRTFSDSYGRVPLMRQGPEELGLQRLRFSRRCGHWFRASGCRLGRLVTTGTVDFPRSPQRFGHVVADVRVTDVAMEIGARDEPRRLVACAAQEKRAGRMHEVLARAPRTRADRSHRARSCCEAAR